MKGQWSRESGQGSVGFWDDLVCKCFEPLSEKAQSSVHQFRVEQKAILTPFKDVTTYFGLGMSFPRPQHVTVLQGTSHWFRGH